MITYTSLLKACGINGRDGTVLLAEEIFAQMQQKTNHFSNTIEPTELTFQRLMQAHVRAPEGQVNTARFGTYSQTQSLKLECSFISH